MALLIGICIIGGISYAIYKFGYSEGVSTERFAARMSAIQYREELEKKLRDEVRSELHAEAHKFTDDIYDRKAIVVKSLIQNALSEHPDNKHLAAVLSDAEDVLLDKQLEDLWNRAPGTANYIKKKFDERAKQWLLEARQYKYQTLLYESMFPKLADYALIDEHSSKPQSRSSDWLSDEEYEKLTDAQKLERAQASLEYYIKGSKSKWEVGRDYELYVGYLYRKEGWRVVQNGINAKIEDLGRDLICSKDGVTHIVQCKFWSQHKEIHEKHIAQLLGTTISYAVENKIPIIELGKIGSDATRIVPVFVTSTNLSSTAIQFANALHVEVHTIVFDPRSTDFPRIKCNIGNEGKIFHLPFDQLYDRVVISKPGEFYAATVKEAMAKGFRRARRWYGTTSK